MTHTNVYQYYFFSVKVPNTGEYRGQFDIVRTNEGSAPECGRFSFPDITSLLIAVIIGGTVIGIIFMIWRKRK